MSYILDALRRADAERERGAVPGIHAQQFAQLPGEDEPVPRSKALLWAIAGLALALLAALGWNFLGHEAPRTVAAPQPPASATLPTAPVAAVLPPAVAASTPAGPAAAASVAPPAHAETAKATRKTTRQAPAPAALPGSAAGRGAAPIATAGGGAEPEKRVYAQRDLPEAVRRELPNVKVSGSTYSTNSASRMLMIGGQIFHEGDTVANGLVLQQIKPRGAVFAFKGYRYELEF